MIGEQAIFNLEIKKKSGLSINPDIHHSKVFSSEYILNFGGKEVRDSGIGEFLYLCKFLLAASSRCAASSLFSLSCVLHKHILIYSTADIKCTAKIHGRV